MVPHLDRRRLPPVIWVRHTASSAILGYSRSQPFGNGSSLIRGSLDPRQSLPTQPVIRLKAADFVDPREGGFAMRKTLLAAVAAIVFGATTTTGRACDTSDAQVAFIDYQRRRSK
jgi:hypothetical protein